MRVVLDQRAVEVLARSASPAKRRVRQIMEASTRIRHEVVVPTVILAELYRGGGHNQMIDAMLSREVEGLALRDTDRNLARLVGAILSSPATRST